MKSRLDYWKVSPQGFAALRHLNDYVEGCGLERSLLELPKTRASQINGCAYCLDMHTKDARAAGESEQRLYTLSAWGETPFFSERERAARDVSPHPHQASFRWPIRESSTASAKKIKPPKNMPLVPSCRNGIGPTVAASSAARMMSRPNSTA